MVYQKEIRIRTAAHGEMHDLTDAVARVVSESGVRTGLVHVFHVGSTGAVGTIEFEPGLQRDLPEALDRLLPLAVTTATNRPGTTATRIRISKPPCWVLPSPCPFVTARRFWAPGSRLCIWNATSNRGSARLS